MTLRPEYSLGHSQYNAFLFESVGKEETGSQLTVLTALTRLGFNAWDEAARLSELPKDIAARDLATTLGRLPDGVWKVSEAEATAARLVRSLPAHSAPPVPSVKIQQRVERTAKEPRLNKWLIWSVVAVGALYLFMTLQPDKNLEPAGRRGAPTQQ